MASKIEKKEKPKKEAPKRPTKAELPPYVLPETGETLLTIFELAAVKRQSVAAAWDGIRKDPTHPQPIKVTPHCTRFSAKALREWIAKKAAESAAGARPNETVLKASRKAVENRQAARAAAAAASADAAA